MFEYFRSALKSVKKTGAKSGGAGSAEGGSVAEVKSAVDEFENMLLAIQAAMEGEGKELDMDDLIESSKVIQLDAGEGGKKAVLKKAAVKGGKTVAGGKKTKAKRSKRVVESDEEEEGEESEDEVENVKKRPAVGSATKSSRGGARKKAPLRSAMNHAVQDHDDEEDEELVV